MLSCKISSEVKNIYSPATKFFSHKEELDTLENILKINFNFKTVFQIMDIKNQIYNPIIAI